MKWPAVVQVKLPPNPYNRGFWKNLGKVLWWEAHLQQAAAAASSAATVMLCKETDSIGNVEHGERDGLDPREPEIAQRQSGRRGRGGGGQASGEKRVTRVTSCRQKQS